MNPATAGYGSTPKTLTNGNSSGYGGGYFDSSANNTPVQNRGGPNDPRWERDTVTLRRAPRFGFGIAVSGGQDNPHFSSGETSIVVSDVAPNGPAEGILKINDRILSVNHQSMEDVYHSDAVAALRQSGDTVTISYKRKVTEPVRMGSTSTDSGRPVNDNQTIRLSKSRNESYGMRLGYTLFVEGLNPQGVAAAFGLRKSDNIIRINNIPVEEISLMDAHNMIERAKEGLDLDIQRKATSSIGRSESASQFDDEYTPPPPRPPLPGDSDDSDGGGGYGKGKPEARRPRDVVDRVPPPTRVQREENFPPPRPPSPEQDGFRDGEPTDLEGESHLVSFNKGGSVGIKLIGGNDVGIYVAGIKPGSPAENAGVAIADRIVNVNDEIPLHGLTKEEVALLLLTLPDFIKLEVRHSRAAFRKVMENGRGDKFYIKAHFAYSPPVGEELSFPRGTVFRVTDTFPEGAMGYWYSIKLDRNNVATERGLIPNNSRATQSSMAQQSVETVRIHNQSGTRGEFFKRRGIRASGRKGKNAPIRIEIEDEYDDIVFGGPVVKFPAYEKVQLGTVNFKRPVVIFGPLADIARDKLMEAMPDRFENPLTEHTFDRTPGEQLKINSQGMVKLGSIRDIMDKNKHCLLDITPHAVEQLNQMQYYPIVIFLNADSRSQVKEVRGHYMSPEQNKGSKKLYKTSMTLKKAFPYLFTAMIPLSSDDSWIQNVKEAVRIQQRKEIWMAEQKYEDDLDDDILPVVGPVILPEGYDTDAESIMPDNTMNSTFDSDIDQMSPTATPNTSTAPTSEPAFSFSNGQEVRSTPKSELPKSNPPLDRYPSSGEEDEERPSSFDRRSRPSRSRSKKKKDSIWSSLRRSMSRSRSRSRDRRKEARELEEEEEEEERERQRKEKKEREAREEQEEREREERVRREEAERNHLNDIERQKVELSLQLTQLEAQQQQQQQLQSSHKSEQQRRREEQGILADEINKNLSKGTDDLTNLSTLADELQSFGIDAHVNGGMSESDHMHQSDHEQLRHHDRNSEPEHFAEQMIVADDTEEEESAPPPPLLRSGGPPKPAERKPLQAVVSPSVHAAPRETDLDAVSPPFSGYNKPRNNHSVMETTFGPDDSDDDDESGPPPPAAKRPEFKPKPKETSIDISVNAGWQLPDFDEDTAPPPARKPTARPPVRPPPPPEDDEDDDAPPKPALPPPKPALPKAKPKPIQPKPLQPVQSKPVESRPLQPKLERKPVETKPLERKPVETKPLERKPMEAKPRPVEPKPPVRKPEPKVIEPIKPVETKPVETKPVEPVYSQVQKNKKPSPRESPLGWDMSLPAPPTTQNTVSPRWDSHLPEPEKQTVTVSAGFVNPQVKKVDLGGDKSEDELSADAYRNQLANMSKLYGRSESPRGWSGGKAGGPSQIKSVRPPKPTTGQTGNAYLDSKKARENFFQGENAGGPKMGGMPYDRDSYQAHKERSMKRSQSPGRLYQEKAGIYPPKNNYNKGPQAIPVDEVALKSDEGQEVVATVRGTFDSNGGVLNSPTTGVSISIPKGALPEGIRQDIYFKVCRDNSMLPPLDKNKGETLLSPLVMCGPHGLKFNKPVELKLPHTASNTQDGWQFNLKSSDAGQGEPAQWKNVNIPGMAGSQAAPVAKTVSVMVDHF